MSSESADPVACCGVPPAAADPTESLFDELRGAFRQYRPAEELVPLESSFRFALSHHANQYRQSGEPYMHHPLAVARILAGMRLDLVTIQTGLLHDVIEDTPVTTEDLRKAFGEDVARCVDGVTKLDKLEFFSAEERQAENYRKMLLAMVSDLRVVLVKLADRLHNVRTLHFLSRDRQERIARETLEIYAPIANRLGMGKVRAELEDHAFRYLEPQAYQETVSAIESRRHSNEDLLNQIREEIEAKLRLEGVPARVESRVKRPYSVHQKTKLQKIDIDQVYDLLALRIITDSVKNCYGALGVIHSEWHPIPGRIKDFIAIPRPNMYQSLHTSVIGPHGRHFEVQIRTEEMHRLAEEGIAAHWKYKEGKKGPGEEDQRIAWLRQLVELQQELRDPGEFISTLKVDLYPEEVCTFTPRGRVIVLPRGATPIDFAYAIHSDVGNTCVGAKVNGRIVPLRYQLRNGDTVEILTQSGHMPSKDWLSLVKTPRARSKIKHVINAGEREKAIEIGQKFLEKEARRLGIQLGKIARNAIDSMAGDYGYGRSDDLYAALGYGKLSTRTILQKLAPEQARQDVPDVPKPVSEPVQPPAAQVPAGPGAKAADGELTIKVKGIDDLMVYRAKCCNPIRGEPIVGYVTRGKGVAVHSHACPNVQSLLYEVERKIEVEWARAIAGKFPVKLIVHTDDRPGMLNQLTSVLSDESTNIRSLEAKTETGQAGDGAVVEMTVDVRDKKQLEKLIHAMRRLPGVRDVQRLLN